MKVPSALSGRASGGTAQYFAVAFVAAATRLIALAAFQATPYAERLLVDAATYHSLATCAAGAGDAYWLSPLYTWFLRVVYAVFGESFLAVRIVQVYFSTLSCLLVVRLGERLFSRAAGLAAGIFFALYLPLAFYDMLHLKVTLSVFILLGALVLLDRFREKGLFRWLMASGIGFGVLVMLRGNAAVAAAGVAGWLLFSSRKEKPASERLKKVGVFLAGAALALAPLTIRNLAVTGDLIFTTYSGGFNLYEGNSPGATGAHGVIEGVERTARSEEAGAVAYAEKSEGRALSPGEVSRFYYKKTLDYVASDPGGTLAGLGRKFGLSLGIYEIPDNYNYHFVSSRVMGIPFTPVGFWLVFPLGAAGLVLMIRKRKNPHLAVLLVSYWAGIILFYVTCRYRLVVTPLLTLAAGHFLVELVGSLRRKEGIKELLVILFSVVAVMVVANMLPLGFDRETGFARERFALATVHVEKGEYAEAVEEYEKAVDLTDPSATSVRAMLYKNIGIIEANRLGRLDRARAALEKALDLSSDSKEKEKLREWISRLTIKK